MISKRYNPCVYINHTKRLPPKIEKLTSKEHPPTTLTSTYKNSVYKREPYFFFFLPPNYLAAKKGGKPSYHDYEHCQNFTKASTFIISHLFLLVLVPEPRPPFFSEGPEPPFPFPLPAGVFLALEFPVPFRSNSTCIPIIYKEQ